MPHDTGRQTQPSEDALKHALRTLTKPCVVVTSCAGTSDTTEFSGATLSSFDMVAMYPKPYVSFNIRVPSRTYDSFQASKRICVHILSASVAGATIADTFTKPYGSSQHPFDLLTEQGAVIEHDESGVAPRIRLDDGNIAWLMCELDSTTQELEVGDHKLCTFVIKDIIASEARLTEQEALSYGQRAFRRLGESVEPRPRGVNTLNHRTSAGVTDQSIRPEIKPNALGSTRISTSAYSRMASTPQVTAAGLHTMSAKYASDDARRPTIADSDHLSGITRLYAAATGQECAADHTTTFDSARPTQRRRKGRQADLDPPVAEDLWSSGDAQSSVSKSDAHVGTAQTTRFFASTAPTGASSIATSLPVQAPPTHVELEVLKSTVADFLCHSQLSRAPRLKRARKARAEMEGIMTRLDRMNLSDVAPYEVDSLERKVNGIERYLMIELAKFATNDLREMLDQGNVSKSRVQYLESCIEKGQTVLLDEAASFAAGEDRVSYIKAHLPDEAAFRKLDEHFRNTLHGLRELIEDEDANMLD